MMRGIYLTLASIIPTGMYGMAHWHAAEGVLRGFITGEACHLRDGDRTSGHRMPRVGGVSRHHGVYVMLPKLKAKSVGPSAGEVPPSDPESRERLEILPMSAGDRVFRSAFDSKAT
jgi:hypothetical protein